MYISRLSQFWFVKAFEDAMDDDFNTADAVAAIFELVRYSNTNADAKKTKEYLGKIKDLIVKLADVLGLIVEKKEEILAEDIEKLNTMLKDFPAEYGYLLTNAALSACPNY